MRSTARLRSPIVEDRSIELLPLDPDRPTVELPPLGSLSVALIWALTPALPFLLLVGPQPALFAGGVGLLIRELNRRAARPGIVFAEGFLRFRGDDAQAQGIQEDDDVRWSWSGRALTGEREDGARPSWPGSVSP